MRAVLSPAARDVIRGCVARESMPPTNQVECYVRTSDKFSPMSDPIDADAPDGGEPSVMEPVHDAFAEFEA